MIKILAWGAYIFIYSISLLKKPVCKVILFKFFTINLKGGFLILTFFTYHHICSICFSILLFFTFVFVFSESAFLFSQHFNLSSLFYVPQKEQSFLRDNCSLYFKSIFNSCDYPIIKYTKYPA